MFCIGLIFWITAQAVVEPTKRSLRVQTWKKLQENKFGVGFHTIFNRIPGFVDSDKAGALLAETDEFKKASKFASKIFNLNWIWIYLNLLCNRGH